MYHLRLIKSLSYSGIVYATKEKPDVYVREEGQVDRLVASGYFVLVSDGKNGDDEIKQPVDKNPGEDSEEPGNESPGEDAFSDMTVDELKAYAEANGISLDGAKKKADILSAIREAEAKAAEARSILREQ